jgi:hypothetical protein
MERMSSEATHIQETMLKESVSRVEEQARISTWLVIGIAITCVFTIAHYYRNRYKFETDLKSSRAKEKLS